tara:strand:- start:648 stop:1124 length:477 start_codon:yes stop_codon:yes gene_type:complete
MKWTDFIVPIIFIWLFQLLIADFLTIGTIRPDFPLILILYFSVRHGRSIGVISGFFLGFIVDLSGTAIFFGLLPMTYSLTGYLAGNLKGLFKKMSPISYAFCWALIITIQFFIFCLIQYQELWAFNKGVFLGKWFGTTIYTLSFITLLQFISPMHKNE